jgi:transcriptional regulator with XRE-family HTH domain
MRLGDKLKRNFARNLQRLREGRGLSQMALAEQLNEKYNHQIQLKRTAIANYEAEEAMPRIDALHCIADYFNWSIDEMLETEDRQPLLRQAWLNTAKSSSLPESDHENNMPAQSAVSAPNIHAAEISNMCRIVAEKTAIHQFYIELTKNFLSQLRTTAKEEKEQQRIDQLFSKTYLGCLIGKTKTMQEQAKDTLTEQEYDVFMAFLEPESDMTIVAKGLDIGEDEALAIFQKAQEKFAQAIGRNIKL